MALRQDLAWRSERREAIISVIGLGYVGVPLACAFAGAGYRVRGLDIDPARVDIIRAGRHPLDPDEPGLERVMPGVLLRKIRSMPRVCGGASPETADLVVTLYRAVVSAKLVPTDLVTAEAEAAGVRVHDPRVPAYRGALIDVAAGADAVIVMVAHEEYRRIDLAALRGAMRTPLLVDGRRAIDPDAARAAGFTYIAIGRPPAWS